MRIIGIVVVIISSFLQTGMARAADEIKRPVVFVPGILGSRLCDPQENIVWGDRTSFSNFSKLEVDVPSNPKLHPCGLVDEIQIIGSLWTHNTYKSWLKGLSDIGFSTEKKTLLIFDYDWRLSNFDNAKLLDEFVTKNIGPGKQFDILAHSMGGIVSRIYLDRGPSAKAVKQIIYLGTPFLGSMNTFGTIKEGWGWPFNGMAGGQDVVARVSLSFAGMLELLPRYEDCCYIRKADNSREMINIFDAEIWRALGWLPPAYTSTGKFQRFSESLKRSKSLTPLLSQSAPPGVYEVIFASDVHDTLRLLGMKEGATNPADWVFTSSKGDGTVPVWSVSRSVKSDNYSNTLPSFEKHEHLFDDKWVDEAISRNLVSSRPNEAYQIGLRGHPVISVKTNGVDQGWPVSFVSLTLKKRALKPGESSSAELVVALQDTSVDVSSGIYAPTATIDYSGQQQRLEVRDLTDLDDLRLKQLRYSVAFQAGSEEGIEQLKFQIVDGFEESQAFYVSPTIQ